MKLKSERSSTIVPMIIFLIAGGGTLILCLNMLSETEPDDGGALKFILGAAVGGLFVLLSIFFAVSEIKRRLDKTSLLNGGVLCKGTIIAIEEHPIAHTNYVHPQTALCQYSDHITGGLRTIKSEYYYNNLGLFVGREVDIYIDKENSDKYYVDMSKLADSYEDSATKRQTYDFRE